MKQETRDNGGGKASSELQMPNTAEMTSSSTLGGSLASQGSKDGLAHLPPDEREVIQRQVEIKPSAVNYFTLYRFATKLDLFVIAGSSFAAIAGGTALPLMTLVLGNLAGTFSGLSQDTQSTASSTQAINESSLYMVYIGVGEFVAIYLGMLGFIFTGQRITQRIREEYLRAIMRQNIGFFDTVGAGETTKRITTDTNLIQEGISEKVALTIISLSIFISAFVVGFIKSWALTLVMSSTVVTVILIGGVAATFTVRYSKQSLQAYSGGGTIAQEVISSIRSTTAFSIQEKLASKYRHHLQQARKWEVKKKMAVALMIAGIQWTASANDGLAYWQGARFLVSGYASVSSIVTIAANILVGALSLGAIGPYIEAFTTAIAAGNKIYSTIDRQSPLDPSAANGQRPTNIRGVIELRNIRHIYPSRPDVVALVDVNLLIPRGRTTALVGASGSGKSTIVGLLERFYNPVGGDVYIDGINVRDINLRFLRQQMALVSQEPTLFNTTIEANIAFGLEGSSSEGANPEKRRQLVVEAAKMANAHDFITQLPQQYDTSVGECGALLSGGQKQRIAIARAVIGNPKILILDEATSALDTTSESVVQAALDRAAKGRTTIVVAHRLSTIKHADNIVVMDRGSIIEQGRHDILLAQRGAYYNLVTAQQVTAGKHVPARISTWHEADEDIERLPRRGLIRRSMTIGSADSIRHSITSMSSFNLPSLTDTMYRSLTFQSSIDGDLQLAWPETQRNQNPTEKKQIPKKKKYTIWQTLKFIASFNRQERTLLMVGLFASVIAGCCYPTSVVFLAKCITTLFLPPSQYGTMLDDISFWASMFFTLAWVNLIAAAAQGLIFAYCSERLTFRARDGAFRTMLRQDIGFFDADENTTGALTSFLFTETTQLAGLSGATLGTILTFLCTLIASLSLGIGIGWKLGLVYTTCVPLLVAAGFFRLWMLARFEARAKKENEMSASQACEATAAIRTVASLTLEDKICDTYSKHLAVQRQKAFGSMAKSSTFYAFSQSALLWCMALGFWYGGTLIISGQYDTLQLFICLSAIIIGAQGSGVIFSFAPDMGKAKHAAEELQALFDRRPTIDIWSDAGRVIDAVDGAIQLRDVHFHYPTRPEQPILRGLDISVEPGQFVALVGKSGSGKSTIIQLLERFYDPTSGSVLVDDNDISKLKVNEYRSFLALVSQEPALYDGTIKENILLGAADVESQMTEKAIIQACKDANIYDFILSLPDGFNTLVGSKGSMLSGGQKQRVAIARALIRNPRVLLLDEATSALDSESEKVVQAALDQAARGRTTVAVAHRLSTIQHADVIFVVDQGRVVEKGTHQELLSKGGQYAELVKLQSLEKGSVE